MKTSELIAKAHKIASKYLDVNSVSLCMSTNFKNSAPETQMQITVYYNGETAFSNYSAVVYPGRSNYSAKGLLKVLKAETEKTRLKLYPEAFPVTDFEIDEPANTADHE